MVVTFRVELIKTGNAVGIIVPQEQLDMLGLKIGDEVDIMLKKVPKQSY